MSTVTDGGIFVVPNNKSTAVYRGKKVVPTTTAASAILAEDGSYILAEDGSKILTD
jgi:hypothetical protein